MPMTSNFTLYLWPFHLRKHLKDPIGLISLYQSSGVSEWILLILHEEIVH